MTKPSKGMRHGTRRKLKKGFRERFKPERFIQEFKPEDKVIIKQNASSHKMPHPIFKGRIGRVREKRGRAYIVEIRTGNKAKELMVKPEHLIKLPQRKQKK